MAGPGNKGNLDPAPARRVWFASSPRVLCGSRRAPVPACTQSARGNTKQHASSRGLPAAHLTRPGSPGVSWPPRARAAAEGGGDRERDGGGGGEAADARAGGGGGGGGERGWVGGATSRLLWLSRYIRSRRPAALPTLPAPAPSQRFSTHPAFSETRRAPTPTERTWAERWWPGSDWGCCFWRCSYPRR